MDLQGPEGAAEKILKTYHHLRIVKALAQTAGSTTKYQIQKTTGINPRQISKILTILKEHGLVEEINTSPKRFRLNRDNIHIQRLLALLEGLGYL